MNDAPGNLETVEEEDKCWILTLTTVTDWVALYDEQSILGTSLKRRGKLTSFGHPRTHIYGN